MWYNNYKGWITIWKSWFFVVHFLLCIQDKKELPEQPIDNKDLKDVCEVYDFLNEPMDFAK